MHDAAVTSADNVLNLRRLPKTVPRSGVSEQARLALRQLLGDMDRQLADAFFRGVYSVASSSDPKAIEPLVLARARAVERVVAHVWVACVGDNEALALLAVGGFGRGELFPYSDVDLLVLTQAAPEGALGRALELFFSCLWDIGLKPGHAVRTLTECRELAGADATIYTSLLDARLIHGSQSLTAGFALLMVDAEIWPPTQFFLAKRAEEEQRRARFNDTAYNLEPNLKEGPGGLRALQLILWLGQRHDFRYRAHRRRGIACTPVALPLCTALGRRTS
jgi:[protein-PII] uridylyltransferase